MTRDEVLTAFDDIRVWHKGDKRAVHKPLLILFALARVMRGETALIDWNDAEPHMKELLEEFGRTGSSKTRHNPFWHLRTDKLWILDGPPNIINRPAGATPTLAEFRQNHVLGGFSNPIYQTLKGDPQLVTIIARRIVDAHFPDSISSEVLAAVGLPTEIAEPEIVPGRARRRDPAFREKVLRAYQYRCGVCGHDLRLGRQNIGLEAAHIKWFQAQGEDIVPNGIALCSLHHKVFDLGAFSIEPESFRISFSEHLNGNNETTEKMLAYEGASLILPQAREYYPRAEFLEWHQTEVFKAPARS